MGSEEFTLAPGFESSENFDLTSLEWDTRGPETFLESALDATPFTRRNQVFTSTWAGSYSTVLHNIPWFQLQRMIKTSGWSIT